MRFIASTCCGALMATHVHAGADSPCERPALQLIRYEEDYSALAQDECQRGRDAVKYIPISNGSYLSFGGDLRERYEAFRNPDWGRDPEDRGGYLLHRLMLHGDAHVGSVLRLFVQVKNVLAFDRTGGARPTDEDELDVHQAFGSGRVALGEAGEVLFRGGRQEVAFGSSRLISVREGPNVRRSFDGLDVIHRRSGWQTDAFVFAPVETDPGIFDDGRETGEWLWGVYAAGLVRDEAFAVDVYYLGVRRPDAMFEQGSADELRHSVGTRLSGEIAAVDYNAELIYQWGRFGSADIRAWAVASDTGVTIHALPTTPRIGLKADVTSGDADPADADLQTFNALYPRGNYFGEASLVGPMNHADVHPSIDVQLTRSLVLTVDWLFFWRYSTADALYRVSGAPQVSSGMSDERYVGSQPAVTAEWQVDRHLALVATYARFVPGAFLADAGLSRPVDFGAFWALYRM